MSSSLVEMDMKACKEIISKILEVEDGALNEEMEGSLSERPRWTSYIRKGATTLKTLHSKLKMHHKH